MWLRTKGDREFKIKFRGESHTLTSTPKEFDDAAGNHLLRLIGEQVIVSESDQIPQEPEQDIVIEDEIETVEEPEAKTPARKAKRKAKR